MATERTEILVVRNSKGRVEKTTSWLDLASAVEMRRKKVPIVDEDPQTNVTDFFDIEASGDDLQRRKEEFLGNVLDEESRTDMDPSMQRSMTYLRPFDSIPVPLPPQIRAHVDGVGEGVLLTDLALARAQRSATSCQSNPRSVLGRGAAENDQPAVASRDIPSLSPRSCDDPQSSSQGLKRAQTGVPREPRPWPQPAAGRMANTGKALGHGFPSHQGLGTWER